VHLPAGFNASAGASPAALAKLPPAVHSGFIQAYAASLHTVFLVAVPISAAAFALSWLLQEVPLRRTSTATNPADTLAPTSMPSQSTSADEIGRALSVLAGGEARKRIYQRLAARAGLDLDPRSVWMLFRIYDHPEEDLDARARRLHRPAETIRPLLDGLAARGLAAPLDGASGPGAARDGTVHLTSQGDAAVASLVSARRTALAELIKDWNPEQHAELAQLLTRLARSLTEPPAPAK
jgi:DNA-binding MarR family transcriptional regulator